MREPLWGQAAGVTRAKAGPPHAHENLGELVGREFGEAWALHGGSLLGPAKERARLSNRTLLGPSGAPLRSIRVDAGPFGSLPFLGRGSVGVWNITWTHQVCNIIAVYLGCC